MSSRTFMRHLRAGAAAGRVPPLGRSADLEDLGPADGADPLSRGAPVLHSDLLRILYLTRGLALDAIACGQRSTSRRMSLSAAYPSPLARQREGHTTTKPRPFGRGSW